MASSPSTLQGAQSRGEGIPLDTILPAPGSLGRQEASKGHMRPLYHLGMLREDKLMLRIT